MRTSSIGPADRIWDSMAAPSSTARSPTTGAIRSRGSSSVASSVWAVRRASVDASSSAAWRAPEAKNTQATTAPTRSTAVQAQSERRRRLVREPNITSSRFVASVRSGDLSAGTGDHVSPPKGGLVRNDYRVPRCVRAPRYPSAVADAQAHGDGAAELTLDLVGAEQLDRAAAFVVDLIERPATDIHVLEGQVGLDE